MSFLPEEDQEFLARKGFRFELFEDKQPDGTARRAVHFPEFEFTGNLRPDGATESSKSCGLLVLVPKGYATTQLDSFYTAPVLKRQDGTFPDRAHSTETHFGRTWQFWSRHLTKEEWRIGVDGFETYLQYVRGEFKRA